MFIKITTLWGNSYVLNSAYIVELYETTADINGKKYPVVRITMSDGEKHEARDNLAVVLKLLAGAK
jgi:hypothetical protein